MTHLLFAALLNTADAKKSKGEDNSTSTDNAQTEQATSKKEKAANVPADKTSQKYAATLLETTGKGFSPNAMGLTYLTITFHADNTFRAEGLVSVMDEEMDCIETGTWNMDPATSENTANMDWTITATDCPSRQAPIQLRLEVVLTGTEAGINGNFR